MPALGIGQENTRAAVADLRRRDPPRIAHGHRTAPDHALDLG